MFEVLHIEDSKILAEAVVSALREYDMRSTHVSTLACAMKYLQEVQRSPDVILLDLCLPDSKGLATLVAVVHEARGCPIVVFTGKDADEGDLKTIRRGAKEYLVKGTISLTELAGLLLSAVEESGTPRVVERTDSQVVSMVERVRHVMEG